MESRLVVESKITNSNYDITAILALKKFETVKYVCYDDLKLKIKKKTTQ